MYRIIISLLLIFTSLNISANQNSAEILMENASKLYSSGKYEKASELYIKIIETNGDSFEAFYNLANAKYKMNDIASAILYYEKALKIRPGDKDTRFNLELCEAKIVDKIVPVGKFLIVRWYESIGNNFNTNTWAMISLIFFIITMISLIVYFFSRHRWLKKTGFYTSVISLIFTILCLTFTAGKYNEAKNPDKAIIFTPTVTVKSSPDASGTDLFILHEGTKVNIKSEIGNWKEIELIDGNVGWIESMHLRII